MKKIDPGRWQLLVISLPGSRGTARMRIWRALKAAGAAVLRDGVYLLPEGEAARDLFAAQALEVERAGGQAHVLTLNDTGREQAAEFRALFDRSADYAELLEKLRSVRQRLSPRNHKVAAKSLRQLRRDYEAIHVADHFPSAAAGQARELLEETAALIEAASSPGEPSRQAGKIPRLERRDYRGRQWATRARPWVDRMASAWLIKRHVDPHARFVWLKQPKDCPKRALGFDFDGADFTHAGRRVTFETILASFGLEDDAALMRLATIVHFLDVGGAPVAEAAGLEGILRGMRERIKGDDALLAEAIKIFDNLYHTFSTNQAGDAG